MPLVIQEDKNSFLLKVRIDDTVMYLSADEALSTGNALVKFARQLKRRIKHGDEG